MRLTATTGSSSSSSSRLDSLSCAENERLADSLLSGCQPSGVDEDESADEDEIQVEEENKEAVEERTEDENWFSANVILAMIVENLQRLKQSNVDVKAVKGRRCALSSKATAALLNISIKQAFVVNSIFWLVGLTSVECFLTLCGKQATRHFAHFCAFFGLGPIVRLVFALTSVNGMTVTSFASSFRLYRNQVPLGSSSPSSSSSLSSSSSSSSSVLFDTFPTVNDAHIACHKLLSDLAAIIPVDVADEARRLLAAVAAQEGFALGFITTSGSIRPLLSLQGWMNKNQYLCEHCDYKCTTSSNLNRHMLTHTGEKPFACEISDYKCTTRDNLDVHVRTHTGEKQFACEHCDYKCSQKSNLDRHMRAHTVRRRHSSL